MSRQISQAAIDLIVAEEVTGRSMYVKRYQRPEWPRGQSGITIGIGYDCGYATPAAIRTAWSGRIPAEMVEVLATRAAGLKGKKAQQRLAEVRGKVLVPWEAAIGEFTDVEMPRWIADVCRVLPNADQLPADCLGAIVSLAYNRGIGTFTLSGDRYKESRTIRALMASENFAAIPAEFRKMKRLWKGTEVSGLVDRREREAKLFERGLRAMAPQRIADIADVGITKDKPAIPVVSVGNEIKGDPITFRIQSALKSMNYIPGRLDGVWGGGTAGAVSAFLNDRQSDIFAPTSQEAFDGMKDDIASEVALAQDEGWSRPVSDARASADPKVVAEIAPEVTPARRNFFATAWASAVAFVSGVVEAASDKISAAWRFWTDHKDDVPGGSDALSSIWDYVGMVPISAWIMLGAGILAYFAWNARASVKAITTSVQTGARL